MSRERQLFIAEIPTIDQYFAFLIGRALCGPSGEAGRKGKERPSFCEQKEAKKTFLTETMRVATALPHATA
jgi:hypothetical protein